eukprot:4727008-Prymnesium_polylepis.2
MLEAEAEAPNARERLRRRSCAGRRSPPPTHAKKASGSAEHAARAAPTARAGHDVGYRICHPGMDPFDQCVQTCVANLTFVPEPPAVDHTLAVCKKRLRLTCLLYTSPSPRDAHES